MKTKVISQTVLVLLMVVFVVSLTRAAKNPEQSCAEKMWKKLSENVKYPDFAVRDKIEGKVTVIFTVSETGSIRINHVVSDEPRLASFIKKTLAELECDELSKAAGTEFKVRFRFHFIGGGEKLSHL